jgi:DNA repair exonuclease SbcCD ATPase subunit
MQPLDAMVKKGKGYSSICKVCNKEKLARAREAKKEEQRKASSRAEVNNRIAYINEHIAEIPDVDLDKELAALRKQLKPLTLMKTTGHP